MDNNIHATSIQFYQSANADAETIRENFIVRKREYELIINDIRKNFKSKSNQHYLLLGRRGSGKSTLLRRLQIEIESDEQLKQQYFAVNLAEEQASIYRLFDLWLKVIEVLDAEGVMVDEVAWKDGIDENIYTRDLFEAIHKAISSSGKKIILLLDNIDRIFENIKSDASTLREILLNYNDLKVIGGSTRMTEHFWRYDMPFYEFFRIIKLEPLTSEEIKELLMHWSEVLKMPELEGFVKNKPGQLETVRILTDGLPRTLQFFVNILINKRQETGYDYLRLILDKATPQYQERLNLLPPAQQKIVQEMAKFWEAIGTKEISSAAKMTSNTVSAQLKQLADAGIVTKIETGGKKHLYRITERFFNLWIIFTQGSPAEKRKAKYLTTFLENFYDEEQFKRLAKEHLETLAKADCNPSKVALLSKAFAQSKYITSDIRDRIIENTLSLENLSIELREQLPETIDKMFEKMAGHINDSNFDMAIKIAEGIEQTDGVKNLFLSIVYLYMEDFIRAEKEILSALEKDKANETFIGVAGAIYNKSGKYDLAKKYYLEYIECVGGDGQTYLILGNLNRKLGENENALKYFKMALEEGETEAYTEISQFYIGRGDYDTATRYLLDGVKMNVDTSNVKLSALYYYLGKNKEDSLELIRNLKDFKDKDFVLLILEVWNGIFVDVEARLTKSLQLDYDQLAATTTLTQLMVHNQLNIVLNIFENEQLNKHLKEELLPIYYAALTLSERKKDIHNIIPPELSETVDSIVEEIKNGNKFYYG